MKRQWSEKEKKDAKEFGSRRTPRSGGLWFWKGDVSNDVYLIEDKTSGKNSFSITARVWKKIEREALLSHRIPLMSLEFGDDKIELVVISKDDFLASMKEVNK